MAVIELVERILKEERPADAILVHYFRHNRYMGSKDRAAVKERFYRILRRFLKLTWAIEQQNYSPSARHYVILDSMFCGEHTPETLAKHVFTGEQYAPKPLTSAERTLAEAYVGQSLEALEGVPDRIRLECPEWAWKPLSDTFGARVADLLQAMQVKNDIHLRVNRLKAVPEDIFQALKGEGLDCAKGQLSPDCVRVKSAVSLTQHDLYKTGKIEIQNEGSQLIALACDVKPGMRVVDFCAGAGGKTLALAAFMKNKGRITACDVLEGRLQRAKKRFRRADVHNIETRPLSSERDPWVKRHKNSCDVVLVDAPCSGVGTWRGDPDKRIRQLGPGLSQLVPLQKEILDSAARLVKPGGRLVYATCSLLPIENEDQIQGFLDTHPEFELIPLTDQISDHVVSDRYMKANPLDHDCDGFFAAVLQKKS